jgi:hypothetical protein
MESVVFGDKCVYAIELIHDPLSDESYLTGRICMHFHNKPFGYLDQFGFFCTVYCALLNKLNCMKELKCEFNLNDEDVFNFLDNILFAEGELVEINDAEVNVYRKFDFLTLCANPAFDGTKSFIYVSENNMVCILYKINEEENKINCVNIQKNIFEKTTREFIKWYEEMENNEVQHN